MDLCPVMAFLAVLRVYVAATRGKKSREPENFCLQEHRLTLYAGETLPDP